MSIAKHIKEHAMLGLLGMSSANVHYASNKSQIAAAINNITNNLVATTLSGTVSVTNGSPTITFSSAPADNAVVAGRSLFTVDGSRYYQLKSGPTLNNGVIFTLAENYVGSTNAAAAFTVYEPNPHSIVLMPGVYDYTDDALAANITLKPFVSIAALDRASTIVRRNKANGTPTTTPVIAMFHGCELSNFTIDTVDGHFNAYRMGLSAYATTQTQAMLGSRWILRNMALLNKDPNGIDSGADYVIDSSYYNSDELLLEDCFFEHCWDGFTWNTQGSGRLSVKFIRPKIWKLPLPDYLNHSGATFVRAGITGSSTTDILMQSPLWDQRTYSAGEVVDDSAGGVVANLLGTSGCGWIGNGATMKVIDPIIDADFGANYGRCAGFGIAGTAGTATLDVRGGFIRVLGAGAAGSSIAGVQSVAAGTVNASGVDIEATSIGIRNNHASSTTNLRGGSRVKGTTNSLVNTAGTFNNSANTGLSGATSGTITAAET